MRSKLIFLLLGLVPCWLFAQIPEEPDSSSVHELLVNNTLVVSAGEKLPFWLQANNSARLSADNPWGVLTSITSQKQVGSTFFDYFYGLEAQAFAGQQRHVDMIQAYAGVKVSQVSIHLGYREEFMGINDSTLSVSNLTYGNNARPIPKLVIRTPDWVRAPILGDLFSFKAYLAHGWFERDRYQSGAMLHQKMVHVRGQALKKRLSIIAGLHHTAQWGGESSDNGLVQPTSLSDFARIFLGAAGGENAPNTDQLNALGNHLGTYDLSASYRFKKITISHYWQFIWEDKSGLTPYNWRDGLIGLSIKSNKKEGLLTGFNVELVRTGSQDARKNDNGVEFIEPDNFFNNGIYSSGWTYNGRVIGNPMFFVLNPEINSLDKVKNVMNGVNVGLEGCTGPLTYRVNYLSFKNHGTIRERIDPGLRLNVFSVNAQYEIDNHIFGLRSSIEWGNYPGRNAGFMFSYARRLFL